LIAAPLPCPGACFSEGLILITPGGIRINLRAGLTHDPDLTPDQLARLTASADQQPFDADARLFRLPRSYSPQRTQSHAEEETMHINEVSGQIVDAAMKVHTALGPGLLESAYEGCLLHELRKRGLRVEKQVALPVVYDGVQIDVGYRIDLLVEDLVIVELKSVEALAPIHEAQLLTYLKLSDKRLGLLINFNVLHVKDGVKRRVNRL
jgi:GxxExxY protein